jgi:hypothetical protein
VSAELRVLSAEGGELEEKEACGQEGNLRKWEGEKMRKGRPETKDCEQRTEK